MGSNRIRPVIPTKCHLKSFLVCASHRISGARSHTEIGFTKALKRAALLRESDSFLVAINKCLPLFSRVFEHILALPGLIFGVAYSLLLSLLSTGFNGIAANLWDTFPKVRESKIGHDQDSPVCNRFSGAKGSCSSPNPTVGGTK